MTIARGAAISSLIAAVIAVGMLMFGAGGGEEYKLRFQTAGQLVNGNNVQIGGSEVGTITEIELTEDNQAEVTINVDDEFAPLHEGTTAVVRTPSLPSIANRYIALTPGPNDAPPVREGGQLGTDRTTTPVDLDQLFNTLDPKTRRALQNLLQGFSGWYVGKGEELNETFKYFSPALATTSELMEQLAADQRVFTDFVVDGSRLVSALAERREDISGFVGNTNAAFQAIGDENVQLARALEFLPGTLRKGNTAFVNLRGALDELDRLTEATKPIADDLAPFFRRLNTLVKTSRPAFHDFALMLRTSGPHNDLLDLLRDLPRLSKVARPSFANSVRSLRKGQSVIEFIRPYAPDFAGWITKFSQATAPYDANGHYARIQPIFNAFSFSENGGDGLLTPLDPAARQSIITDRRNDRRCPGAATQAAKDGSSPFTDDGKLSSEDCDPSLRPPGG